MMDFGWSASVVFGLGLLMGIALSVLNMSLSLVLKIPLFMVTVGTMTIYQGFSFQISQARTIGGFSPFFKFLGQGMIGPIPFPIILTAVLFVIMNIFLRKTYWGQYIYAVGGNEDAAHLTGINTVSVKMMIAIIAGAFVGLSALVMASRIGSMQSAIGPGTEFTVITGILLGGVSFRGGEGRLSGVLAGVLIMAILSNGMQLAHMGVYLQYIAKGSIMLAAIGFDIFQLSRREKAKSKRATPKIRQSS
jgi:ribose/xylose/arabinose/galactoside ABC-type transport system permease subunit